MGFNYEMNWYLVVDNAFKLSIDKANNIGSTTKNENRMYPLGSPIPLIIKGEGCIALIEIKEFSNGNNTTDIIFNVIKYYDDLQDPISSHYYNMYLGMKCKNKGVIGKFDFELLKSGTILKRKEWEGFWKWENDTIMMYCKNEKGFKLIDIRETTDVDFTISNLIANDWEIVPPSILDKYIGNFQSISIIKGGE